MVPSGSFLYDELENLPDEFHAPGRIVPTLQYPFGNQPVQHVVLLPHAGEFTKNIGLVFVVLCT